MDRAVGDYAQNVAGQAVIPRESAWNALHTLLRQLTDSDFVRKVAETYVTQIVLIGLGLVTNVAVARALGPQGRGLYAVAMTVGVTGVQLTNLGLHASNTYYLARNRLLLPILVGNSFAISFGLGGGIAATMGAVFHCEPELAPVRGPLLVLGLLWIPFGLAFLLMENLLLGLQQVRSFNKVELLNRFVSLCLVAGIIVVGKTSPASVLSAMLLAVCFSLGWTYSVLNRLASFRPRPSFKVLRSHVQLGIKAYLIALFGFLLLRIDLLMVKYLLGAEQAGYYSIASTMGDYVLMLPSVIGLILFPRLSAIAETGEKLRQVRKVASGTALALLPVLGVAAVGAAPIVRMLFGKEFLPAVGPFLWLLPGIFAMGVEITMVQFLNSIGYPTILVWVWFASTLLNIALNFWAIPHYGIGGASLVSSISYSLVLFAVLAIIYKGHSITRQPALVSPPRAGEISTGSATDPNPVR
jgi:O-antigen/teichoic acid export membrane protein